MWALRYLTGSQVVLVWPVVAARLCCDGISPTSPNTPMKKFLYAAFAAMFVFGLTACERSTDVDVEGDTTLEEAGAEADAALDGAADAMGDAAEATGDAMGDAADATADAAGDAADAVTDAANDAAEATGDAVDGAAEEMDGDGQ